MICREQLWKVILWVQWCYSQVDPEERTKRPQRSFKHGDGAEIAVLIRKIRHEYWECKSSGRKADFIGIKRTVLKENQLDEATRNFYSSVISTYFNWNKGEVPAEIQKKIEGLDAFVRHFQSND